MLMFISSHLLIISWFVSGIIFHPLFNKITDKKTPIYHQILNGLICGYFIPISCLIVLFLKNLPNSKFIKKSFKDYIDGLLDAYCLYYYLTDYLTEKDKFKLKSTKDVYLNIYLSDKKYNKLIRSGEINLSDCCEDVMLAYTDIQDLPKSIDVKNKSHYIVFFKKEQLVDCSISIYKVGMFLDIETGNRGTEVIVNTSNLFLKKDNFDC